jgi:hypothetical protein
MEDGEQRSALVAQLAPVLSDAAHAVLSTQPGCQGP